MKRAIVFFAILSLLGLMVGCDSEYQEDTIIAIGETSTLDFYHDFDPDIVMRSYPWGDNYRIDINCDSVADLELFYDAEIWNTSGFRAYYLVILNYDFYVLIDSTGIKALDTTDFVSCYGNYSNAGAEYEPFVLSYFQYSSVPVQINDSTWEIHNSNSHSGNFYLVQNKYVALRFLDDNGWHLGWLKLSTSDNGYMVISEYGYKDVIGYP